MFAPRGWLSRRFQRQVYRTLSRSVLFDTSYYRKNNLRGISQLQDPLWHFVSQGWKAGLSPSEYFDTDYYVTKNDDVRVADLNPLFHYEEYGRAERRLPVRSSLEAQHVATPEATPIRYFITPSLGRKRASVLFDSSSQAMSLGNLRNTMKLVSDLAQRELATLRILYRDGALSHSRIEDALEELPATLRDSLEITNVPIRLTYSDVPFLQDEISIATSWSSSLALRYATENKKSFTLVDVGAESYLEANSAELRDALVRDHMSVPRAMPEAVVSALETRGPSAIPGVIAYVDIASFPLAYATIVEAIGGYLLSQAPTVSLPAVTLVGNPGPRFAFAEELHPHLLKSSRLGQENPPANCIILMSDQRDDSGIALSRAGFRVIHAFPQIVDDKAEGNFVKGTVMTTSASAKSIQSALAKAFA